MRTAAALAISFRIADEAARGLKATHTIVLHRPTGEFYVETSEEVAATLEQTDISHLTPIASVYPDGRVDLYREVRLPKEVPHVH